MSDSRPECNADFRRYRDAELGGRIVEKQPGGFLHRVEFRPGYDHRSLTCGHGQHGMELDFILIGPAGATRWCVYLTGLVPGRPVTSGSVGGDPGLGSLYASDLGHHWRTPTYEGEAAAPCRLLPRRRTCFYDGSGIRAGELVGPFLAHGPAAIWQSLHEEYDRLVAAAKEVA